MVAPSWRRRTRLTPATIGASSATRVSLTTTAMATAAAPAGDAAATTCATSCTLSPAHAPRCSGDMPMRVPRKGTSAIAALPYRVTSATPVATSSLSVPLTLSIAAIAEAPQIEKPVATIKPRPGDTPSRRAADRVPTNAIRTVAPRRAPCRGPARRPRPARAAGRGGPPRDGGTSVWPMHSGAGPASGSSCPTQTPSTTATVSALMAGSSDVHGERDHRADGDDEQAGRQGAGRAAGSHLPARGRLVGRRHASRVAPPGPSRYPSFSHDVITPGYVRRHRRWRAAPGR